MWKGKGGVADVHLKGRRVMVFSPGCGCVCFISPPLWSRNQPPEDVS